MANRADRRPQTDDVGQGMDPRIEVLQGLVNVENAVDIPQQDKMFPFSGAWIPSIDGTLIGGENFKTLLNMRYTDAAIEGVNGYTYRNATAITDYTNIKSGVHLKTQGRTQEDYVLVHAVRDSTGLGRIYVNETAPGTTGNFSTSIGVQTAGAKTDYLWQDATSNLTGKFAQAPGENVIYANGEELVIWSGRETTIGSIFTTTSAGEANPIDVTHKLANTRIDSTNVASINAAGRGWFTILTHRPAQAFKFYVTSANASDSTLTVTCWTGAAYAAVGNASDGTTVTGKALAQTGTVTFNSTVNAAKLKHFQGRYLYAYQVALSVGSATISHVTFEAAPQAPTNVWDGIYRTAIQAQYYLTASTAWEDYTLHVAESSSVNVPVGMVIDGMVGVTPGSEDEIVIMFDEPMAGIRFVMLGNLVNNIASTLTAFFWDGSGTWASLTIGSNGTAAGGTKTFGQSGTVTWTPPTGEELVTLFGTQGYAYKFKVSETLKDTTLGKATEDVVIDLITGIPAQQVIPAFKFPVQYKNKLFLCNYAEGNEGNRVDYSLSDVPDVFNGESTSMGGYQSIYVGGSEYLTGAVHLYNRFGSSLFSSLVFFKDNELYLLTGDTVEDYQLFPISFSVGCPAPDTITTAEVGADMGSDSQRNVIMFVSNSGPMMYDGAVLVPIRGMEIYFDPNKADCVNFTYLNTSKGWFDSTYKEWNILIPTGTSTTLDTWLAYDIIRKKWFRKDTGAGEFITCGFTAHASNGRQYTYGGTSVGKYVQLESGTSWGGSPIVNEIQTADIFPSGSEWDITNIRRLKFVCTRTLDPDDSISYLYFADTNAVSGLLVSFVDVTTLYTKSGTAGFSFGDVTAALADSATAGFSWNDQTTDTIDIAQAGASRLVRANNNLNQTAWTHSFRFVYSSDTEPQGLRPIMWGVQYTVVRKDY